MENSNPNQTTNLQQVISFDEIDKKIIKLLCLELSAKEIGIELDINARTVEDRKDKIRKKTGSKSVVGIILYAVKNGLLPSKNEVVV